METRLEQARTEAPPGTEKLSKGDEVFAINYTCSSRDSDYTNYTWAPNIEVTWDDIFYQISPLMIHEASDLQLRNSLDAMVKSYGLPNLKKSKQGKEHSFRNFSIKDEDFQTVKVQLRALGLINKSEKNRSVKDTKTYWTLTPYGDSVMNRLRAIEIE